MIIYYSLNVNEFVWAFKCADDRKWETLINQNMLIEWSKGSGCLEVAGGKNVRKQSSALSLE